MSLGLIIGGVTPVGGGLLQSPATTRLQQAERQDADVTAAVGQAMLLGYSDSFARLTLFESGEQGLQAVNTQTYDGVAIPKPTVQLDYLLLQSMTEAFVDRMSANYSFGASVMATSGVDARQFVYSGCILADAITGDNAARFERAYDSALRASALVSANNPRYVRLTFRDQVREGYITSFSAAADAQHRGKITFSFSMFVFNLD